MTIRPCNEFVDCECSDNPFINTSAEAPDPNLFFARRYFPNIPSLNSDDSWYERLSCLGTCFSEVSQQDAEDCALRNAQLCTWDQVQPALTLLSSDPTSIPRTNIFGNAEVSCTSPCMVGPPSVFTVPANTFYALTQQEADALAQSVCDYRALVNRMCADVPPEPPICDVIITSVMPPSLVIDAEPGDDVSMGVTFDYTGMSTPIFLWLKDTFPLVQTLNPSLNFSPVIEDDTGIYQLVIIIPQCSPVLSPVFTLNVNQCSQSGSPIPDPLFSNDQNPQDLGIFVTPPNVNVSVGSFPPGSFEITYQAGAYGHTLGVNPCPSDPFAYHQGFNRFVTVGFEIPQLLNWFGNFCAATTAAITAEINGGGGPLDETVDHDGGDAMFVSTGQDGVSGSPNPTWHVVYTPAPPPVVANRYEVQDFVNVGPKLVNPNWTDDPMLAAWDGVFGNNPIYDVIIDTYYYRQGCGGPGGCAEARRIGDKRVTSSSIQGPFTGQAIADLIDFVGLSDPTLTGYGTQLLNDGVLVSATRYWWLEAWDACHGFDGNQSYPDFYGWMGVKEYGDDVDGNYRRIYGAHPEAPECVMVTKL